MLCVRASVLFTSHAHKRYAGDPGLVPAQRGRLDFRWAIAMDGAVREANVHVRTDNAMDRGVPLRSI